MFQTYSLLKVCVLSILSSSADLMLSGLASSAYDFKSTDVNIIDGLE